MANSRLEPFEFGRGWELEKFTIEMTAPRDFPMNGYPPAWTPSSLPLDKFDPSVTLASSATSRLTSASSAHSWLPASRISR